MLAHEKVEDCIDRIAEYEEDSLPVLTEDGRIAGILTAQDLVELVDDAMGDDYAKLGGLTSEEDLQEPAAVSMTSAPSRWPSPFVSSWTRTLP